MLSQKQAFALISVFAITVGTVALVAEEQPQDEEELDIIKRWDKGPQPPATKIIQDDYVQVSGKYKSVTTTVPSYAVQDISYAGHDLNYDVALTKRAEGKYTVAALYFTKALEAKNTQPWAKEYCNYGIGEALFKDGKFTEYKGRVNTYAPPSHYFKKALEANPKSRFMPDIVSMLPRCLAEEGKFAEAETAVQVAEARLKQYVEDVKKAAVKDAPGYKEVTIHAAAQLAVSNAFLFERKAAKEKGQPNWAEVRDKWDEARGKAMKYADLNVTAVDGLLRTLVAMQNYDGAIAEASGIIDNYSKAPDNKDLPLLPGAYTARGKATLAKAGNFAMKKMVIQSNNAYADARLDFLYVVAQFFDNDEFVASAHYFAGLCYENLSTIELDAAEKSMRHWKIIKQNFPNSGFKDLAEIKLTGAKN